MDVVYTLPCIGTNNDTRIRNDILVLVTYDTSYGWTKNFINTLEQETEKLPYRLMYNIVPLDAIHIQDVSFWDEEYQMLLPKLASGKYKMTVALDDS